MNDVNRCFQRTRVAQSARHFSRWMKNDKVCFNELSLAGDRAFVCDGRGPFSFERAALLLK